jgi:prepilin-type N-terminal cleavage/methylation domain-containing protein
MHSGFTLVELVVVLIIAAIIGLLAFPKSDNDQLVLAGQADQIASDIRYAQSLAMSQGITSGSRHGLLFTVGASPATYQFLSAGGNTVPNPVTGATPPTLPNFVTAGLTGLTQNLIAFDSKGVPYTDSNATLPLASPGATITLTLNGQTKQITVQPTTGRVLVQ